VNEVIGEDANTVGRQIRADVFTAEYCIPYAADSDFSAVRAMLQHDIQIIMSFKQTNAATR
jgi:hypothetical protein